mmetsp:Transcript_105097/g.255145  ORF Transcript_105097/g.255145 Transcript_105097/m.255145 type:complete len:263 (+) Transcript_105097:325-1113(+)
MRSQRTSAGRHECSSIWAGQATREQPSQRGEKKVFVHRAELRETHLQLGLAAGGGLDCLHEPKAAGLDLGDGVVLGLGDLLVLVLELLELVLEGLLGVLDLLLLLLDSGVEGIGVHGHELLDLLAVVILAQVEVVGRAHRLEGVGELLERVVVAAALVVLQRRRIPVLDRREPLDAVRVAQRLPGGRAVHVRDQSAPLAVHLLHDLVPVRLHPFAVASPRREELDEDGLAGRLRVPVVRRQLDGRGGARQGQRHECDRGFHC